MKKNFTLIKEAITELEEYYIDDNKDILGCKDDYIDNDMLGLIDNIRIAVRILEESVDINEETTGERNER